MIKKTCSLLGLRLVEKKRLESVPKHPLLSLTSKSFYYFLSVSYTWDQACSRQGLHKKHIRHNLQKNMLVNEEKYFNFLEDCLQPENFFWLWILLTTKSFTISHNFISKLREINQNIRITLLCKPEMTETYFRLWILLYKSKFTSM